MTDQASPVEPPAASAWTPKVGLVLRHKAIQQTIEITGAMVLDGLPTFWQVKLYGAYGDPKGWMIIETALMDQYEAKETR